MTAQIIGIVGSRREGSNTEIMVRTCLEEARRSGASTELILLRDLNFEFCDGCLKCDDAGECHIDDGMNQINQKLAAADGIVFGTPARWRLLSGDLKVFLDRTNPLAVPKTLSGKKAGVVAVGQTSGPDARSIREAANSVIAYCKDNDMDIVGVVIGKNALKERDILKNRAALEACKELGSRIAEAVLGAPKSPLEPT